MLLDHLTNFLDPTAGWVRGLFFRSQAAKKNLNLFRPNVRIGRIRKK
jgi:hypothetical protein